MIDELQVEAATNGLDPRNQTPSSDLPYAALTVAFGALVLLASRLRREDGTQIALSDVACVGLASHDLARIVARDRITVFLRTPFASGQAAQYPRGSGVRRAVGELLTCPHCLSLWAAAIFSMGFVRLPGPSRFVAGVFAGHAVAGACEAMSKRVFPR